MDFTLSLLLFIIIVIIIISIIIIIKAENMNVSAILIEWSVNCTSCVEHYLQDALKYYYCYYYYY